jgi:hypothetical protein
VWTGRCAGVAEGPTADDDRPADGRGATAESADIDSWVLHVDTLRCCHRAVVPQIVARRFVAAVDRRDEHVGDMIGGELAVACSRMASLVLILRVGQQLLLRFDSRRVVCVDMVTSPGLGFGEPLDVGTRAGPVAAVSIVTLRAHTWLTPPVPSYRGGRGSVIRVLHRPSGPASTPGPRRPATDRSTRKAASRRRLAFVAEMSRHPRRGSLSRTALRLL